MKVFVGLGLTVRLAILCLLAGIGVGLFLGASAVSPDRPAGTPAVTAHLPEPAQVSWSGGR